MPGDSSRDVSGRLAELEATVRGLTQEVVSANERLRELEAAVEERDAAADGGTTEDAADESAARPTPADHETSTDQAPDDDADEGERADLDDIIVA